jgi:hypothetical protein
VDDVAHTWSGSIDLGLPGDGLRTRFLAPRASVRPSGARRLPAGDRWSERVGACAPGRICTAAGCRTVLSIYNATPYCALHEPEGIVSFLRRTTRADVAAPD